jgi:integrase
MSKAWVYQATAHKLKAKEQYGDESKAPWSTGWLDPNGRRRSKLLGSKSKAQKHARKVEGQLAAGVYQAPQRATYADFRKEYREKIVDGMDASTAQVTMYALANYERICKPLRMSEINSKQIAGYVAKRRLEPARRTKRQPKEGETVKMVSPATINRELRTIRHMVRVAHQWEYLAKVPAITFLRQPVKLPTYIAKDEFDELLKVCDQAQLPAGLPYSSGLWWTGFLRFASTTGWRIGSILALKRENVDLEAGTALSKAKDNKGRRDQLIRLTTKTLAALSEMPSSLLPAMFPWSLDRRALYTEFHRLQTAAGIKPAGGGKSHYGFHDIRRSFCTWNIHLPAPVLQKLMEHIDPKTTQVYINASHAVLAAAPQIYDPDAPRLPSAVENLYVPRLRVAQA